MTTTGAPVLTGAELRELRRGLNLSDESFAKYLGVTMKYYRKAERFGDDPIDSAEFKGFLERLVQISPQMIIAKMQAMHQIAEGLKVLGIKLKRTEKWLAFEKRSDDSEEAEESPAGTEEKEAKVLSGGGIDKRSCVDDG